MFQLLLGKKAVVKTLRFLDVKMFPIDILEDKTNEEYYENTFS